MGKFLFSVVATGIVTLASFAVAQGTEVPLGSITTDPQAPVEVSADSLSVDQSDGSAIFKGNVVAGQGDLRLSADEVRVEYGAEDSENAGEILSIIATGNVVLLTGAESAKGNSAIYDLEQQKISMQGDVILTQGRNAVSGNEMVFDLVSGTANFIGRVRTILQTGDGG